MRLFLDTTHIDDIAAIERWGVLDGVTVDPTLAAPQGIDSAVLLKEIATVVDGDVSAPVVPGTSDEMVDEARRLAAIAPNVVVRIPVLPEGLAAVSRLTREQIRTDATLCFSSTQAILAARAGAAYVSYLLGRDDDIANDGIAQLTEICEVFRVQGYETEVLAASPHHPRQVAQAALAGADVAALPAEVFRQMVTHPLTDRGLEANLADSEEHRRRLQDADD